MKNNCCQYFIHKYYFIIFFYFILIYFSQSSMDQPHSTLDFKMICKNKIFLIPYSQMTMIGLLNHSSTKHNQSGGLLLGNIKLAENQKQLKKLQIGAIVSVFGQKNLFINPTIKHFRILISDHPSQNIKCFFNSSNNFIKENIVQTNVYVHCLAGISRSSTIVAAYLMSENSISLQTALEKIKKKRNRVCPNKGFIKQLHQYQNELKQQHNQSKSCVIM